MLKPRGLSLSATSERLETQPDGGGEVGTSDLPSEIPAQDLQEPARNVDPRLKQMLHVAWDRTPWYEAARGSYPKT